MIEINSESFKAYQDLRSFNVLVYTFIAGTIVIMSQKLTLLRITSELR